MEDEAAPLATADEAAEATEVAALAMELPMAPATLLWARTAGAAAAAMRAAVNFILFGGVWGGIDAEIRAKGLAYKTCAVPSQTAAEFRY